MSLEFAMRLGAALLLLVILPSFASGQPAASDVASPAQTGSAGGQSADSPLPQIKEVEETLNHFKAGDVERALERLQAAATANPDLPPAEMILSEWFAQAGDLARMRDFLQRAAMRHPEDPQAFAVLGEVNFAERRVVEADLLFDEADRLLASFDRSAKRKELLAQQVLAGRASVAEASEQLPAAQKHLEALVQLAPKNPLAHQRLGAVLFRQKQIDAALERFATAQKLAPEQAIAPEAVVARLYQQEGDATNARKWMIRALEKSPRDANTRIVAGEWSLQNNRIEEAMVQAEAALTLEPQSLDALLLRATVAFYQGKLDEAKGLFKKAHDENPDHLPASNGLALVLAHQADKAERQRGLAYAEVNYRQHPRRPETAATLGWAYYQNGRLEDAEQAFQAAAQLGPLSPDTAYYVARLYADTNRKEDARRLLEQVVRSKGAVAHRADAEKLLQQLGGSPSPQQPRGRQ